MKEKIHPQFVDTTIRCACGEVIQTKSTKENIKVDICSKCHPFFTGKQKFVDAGGRVDKFKRNSTSSESSNILLKRRVASFFPYVAKRRSVYENGNK